MQPMDTVMLTMIVTLANGEATTTTRGFATMKNCEALAAAYRTTAGKTGRTVETKCEPTPSDPSKP